MPQFDPASFASQIFWLAISLIVLYFLLSRLVLPRLSDVLEERSERIANDLERAEALRKEAEGVIAAYEDALAKAREEAQAQIARANADMAEEASKRQSEFNAQLAKRVEEAEQRIAKAKAEAQGEMRSIAVEVAGEVAQKLTGQAPDDKAVTKAVDGQMKGAA
jgi:F-type H+-transporting ATPase subunit b